MNKDEFQKYLSDRYYKEMNWYDTKSQWNHRAYDISQWLTIVLSALTPILIVIGKFYNDWTIWAAASTAVLLAVSTSALRTFKFQENWINYRTTAETLKKEINFYNGNIQPYNNAQDKESMFVERVEALISRENTLWVVTHEKEEKKDTSQK